MSGKSQILQIACETNLLRCIFLEVEFFGRLVLNRLDIVSDADWTYHVSTLQTARFKICELFVYWAYNGNNDDNNDDNIVLFAAAIADAECNDATHYVTCCHRYALRAFASSTHLYAACG